METIMRMLMALVLTGAPALAFAQDGTARPGADIESQLKAQDQLVRELLRRLDAQEMVNAALLKRLTALEAERTSDAPIGPNEAPTNVLQQQPADAVAQLQETTAELEDVRDPLPKIAGYYDFEFFKEGFPGTFGEFRQHHLFLDFSREYRRFRVLGEIEFEYGAKFEGSGGASTDLARGEVSLEQTWAEYVASPMLTARAGLILTPNYWNVNHYANAIASTRFPLMVRNVYPESFVGIMAYGTKHWTHFGVGYDAYVHNGESPFFPREDDNQAKAAGGTLRFYLPSRGLFDSARVAVNGYRDTPAQGTPTRTWGAESQVQRGPFELLFEYARRSAGEDRTGVYIQPSYRIVDKVTTFYRYDRLRLPAGATRANTAGINFHPIPEVALKVEYFRTVRPVDPRGFNGIASSFAVAF